MRIEDEVYETFRRACFDRYRHVHGQFIGTIALSDPCDNCWSSRPCVQYKVLTDIINYELEIYIAHC